MVHLVRLEQLPDSFRVPDALKDRFWYDADKKCLAFDGVMYKSTFDRLHAISDNYAYQRALEELFRKSVPEESVSGRRFSFGALFRMWRSPR